MSGFCGHIGRRLDQTVKQVIGVLAANGETTRYHTRQNGSRPEQDAYFPGIAGQQGFSGTAQMRQHGGASSLK
jgi:hypothetical protein